MLLVVLSIAVLLAAPLVAAVLGRLPALASLLDSFVLVAVGGIVALHVVPQSAELAGPAAVAAAGVGLFIPILLHKLDHALAGARTQRRVVDGALLAVLLVAIVVHGMFDGAALTAGGQHELALGVLLHRVPVGLALWVVVRPKLGAARTLVVVVALVVGTVAGGFGGAALLAHGSAPALALLQAFVAGSILHIVAESAPFATSATPLARAAGVAGAILAALALWGMEQAHGAEAAAHAHEGLFIALSWHVAPAMLASFLAVGALTALYADGAPALVSRHRAARGGDALVGAAAGLAHPLCPCAVAPLYDVVIDNGASPARARAFLVAASALGMPAVMLSLRLLGPALAIARIVAAALLAVAAGITARGTATAPASTPTARAPLGERVGHGLRHGFVDAVDHVGPWILLGLGVAALLAPALLDDGGIRGIPALAQIVALALLALPLYLCPAGATPVAALLWAAGASPGAVLAFLLVGPVTSAPTFALLQRRHGGRAALAFGVVVAGGACVLGVGVDALFTSSALEGVVAAPTVFDDARAPTLLELASVVVMGALLVASLYRQGVRGFLVQIMSPQHEHASDHGHGPGCGHDHGPPIVRAPKPVARVRLDFTP